MAACRPGSLPAPAARPRPPARLAPATPGAIDRPRATTGCHRPPPAGPGTSLELSVAVDPGTDEGRTRRGFLLHVPVDYDPAAPTPLVLVFHGHGGSAAGMERGSGWSTLADRHHLIIVYPQGLPMGPGGSSFWASAGPVDFGVDDLGYVGRVLDEVQSRLCVDPRRIDATGMSAGGGMAGYLLCRLSGRIAAAAPIAGNHYELTKVGCTPRRPVALLEVHGTQDTVVPYDGVADPAWPLPSIPQWLGYWRGHDHCPAVATTFLRIPHLTGLRWAPCDHGTEVVLYRSDGGHAAPATLGGVPTSRVLAAFFARHALPG